MDAMEGTGKIEKIEGIEGGGKGWKGKAENIVGIAKSAEGTPCNFNRLSGH